MNRKLTKREEILLLILVIFLIVVGYFKLYLEPLNEEVDRLNGLTVTETSENTTNQALLEHMRTMEAEILTIKSQDGYREVPAYDNSHAVSRELYSILSAANSYTVNFGSTVTNDTIVSRPVSLTFETSTYEGARAIINSLANSDYLIELGDISISWNWNSYWYYSDTDDRTYTTSMNVIYYEAIYDE